MMERLKGPSKVKVSKIMLSFLVIKDSYMVVIQDAYGQVEGCREDLCPPQNNFFPTIFLPRSGKKIIGN